MARKAKSPKLQATKPKSVFEKSFQVDLKGLFKALSKGVAHTACGKWEEVGTDAAETLSAVGLATEPEELAFQLINRSITQALFELAGENASLQLIDNNKASDDLIDRLDFSMSSGEVYIDHKFLDQPAELSLLKEVQSLLQKWLEGLDVSNSNAKAIADRLPSYFVYSLNQEWRKNAKSYGPIIEALDTPFSRAGDREWAWAAYSALLQHRIHEGIFDEPFSLSQIYVPLNAFYSEEKTGKKSTEEMARGKRTRRRFVVSLEEELEQWLNNHNQQDVIRVISGGPGSGKSSFARIFAAKLSNDPSLKVLYVPLHLIDASKDLVEEIGRFVKDEGVLLHNPLDSDSPEPNLLIIFDGLDELASQGKAAAEAARAFIREVERTVEKRNMNRVSLRVLISGRELVVQENESEFRRPRQVLNLLPYWIPRPTEKKPLVMHDDEEYYDPEKLLENDLRQQWWKKYGALTGRKYTGLPNELDRDDLTEITAQPLLNYLVALSFSREKLDFTKDINLNSIYADLVAAVHERGYEKHRAYVPIRHMKLDDFFRVLEEIGMASWHGDGRTTTVREIEKHCRDSGVGVLLDAFQEGARAGVTRLLAAFFFRQYGERAGGDPTFVFTHKSFGEYLTARRIVRAIERVNRELHSRAKDPDCGWDKRDALKHWAQIFGPSVISQYLYIFFLNEMRLRPVQDLAQWQGQFSKLFGYMLQHGMPMEQLQILTFKDAVFQSRNAEEALLAALNACARVNGRVSEIEYLNSSAFGAWFKRVQGQRVGYESVLAAECLSYLKLVGSILQIADFYHANFYSSDLEDADLEGACLQEGYLKGVNLKNAVLEGADLRGAYLENAVLEGADLGGANLENAYLKGAIFKEAFLGNANLEGACFIRPDFEGAILLRADLRRADLKGANLRRANLEGADLRGASLEGANLHDANLKYAFLEGAKLEGAELEGTILE